MPDMFRLLLSHPLHGSGATAPECFAKHRPALTREDDRARSDTAVPQIRSRKKAVAEGAGTIHKVGYERPSRYVKAERHAAAGYQELRPLSRRPSLAERKCTGGGTDSKGMHTKRPQSRAAVRPSRKECRRSTAALPGAGLQSRPQVLGRQPERMPKVPGQVLRATFVSSRGAVEATKKKGLKAL